MISYTAIHLRLRAAKGRAAEYPCVAPGCSSEADEWALIGPAKFQGAHGRDRVRWTDDLSAYEPTCRKHNRQLDAGGSWEACKRGHLRAETGSTANGECRGCGRDRCRRNYAERQKRLVTR